MDLKIPPLVILLVSALAQIELADYLPIYSFGTLPLWIPILWWAIGCVVMLLGVVEFRRKQTTVNPMKPDEATALVTSGIFKYTRNPMYLGMTLVLVGGTFYWSEVSTWIAVIFFIAYIHYFQIKPEERMVEQKFGESFQTYKANVRRWL